MCVQSMKSVSSNVLTYVGPIAVLGGSVYLTSKVAIAAIIDIGKYIVSSTIISYSLIGLGVIIGGYLPFALIYTIVDRIILWYMYG